MDWYGEPSVRCTLVHQVLTCRCQRFKMVLYICIFSSNLTSSRGSSGLFLSTTALSLRPLVNFRPLSSHARTIVRRLRYRGRRSSVCGSNGEGPCAYDVLTEEVGGGSRIGQFCRRTVQLCCVKCGRGGGKVKKIPKILRMSYVHGPLCQIPFSCYARFRYA